LTAVSIAGYYSTRLYNVSFDHDFLYFSRFGRERRVGLDQVSDIKIGVVPWPFYLTTYLVTIFYSDGDRVKKIKFFSRGLFRIVGSIREIPHLDTLRKFIKEKKYGR
jgi:hypothetical protein